MHALAMDGDFDDCQAMLKDMFNDFDFRDEVRLAGVNSINWGRVLAQVVYYFTAAVSLGAPQREVSFTCRLVTLVIFLRAILPRKWACRLPILWWPPTRNDILHRTLQTGAYTKEGVIPSISPSMDIQVSSNFERALFDAYWARWGGSCSPDG